MRVNITVPDDWHAAITDYCVDNDLSFSEFVTDAAIEKLPASVRKKLSVRRPAHRPKKEI